MRNKPLALQIWLVFAGITLFISLLFLLLLPWTLKGFFTKQMYQTIQESQDIYLSDGQLIPVKDLIEWDQRKQQYQSVKHMVFLEDGRILSGFPSVPISNNFKNILAEARLQDDIEEQYSRQIENERIYYLIRKGQLAGKEAYLLSYMWESYQEKLVDTLFASLMWIIAGVLLFSWLPSFLLARYLSRPLISMEEHVRRIADRDWYDPLECQRQDEIGMLAQSIERMRQCLLRQDEAQQSFLQHISHELKTPVMVIRSYAQAIADGIFPRGGLEGSIKVIDEEAERMEKRIKDLLYLTKLDYLVNKDAEPDEIDITELLEHVVDLLRWQRTDIEWQIKSSYPRIKGDYEQWKVAFENLLDNQIRYAESGVKISVNEKNNDRVIIRIWNDGPPIEEKLLDRIFNEYQKGYQGQFGLGLAIVKQVALHHHARVWAVNENEGVAFYINIPFSSSS